MRNKILTGCVFLIVLITAYFTYFHNYQNPTALFWDENYHIAAAEKYLNRMMFMESHSPLGKMLVAMGEWIWHPNDKINKSAFLTTDYIKEIPKDYSFVGVRFFPALLAMLAALVFFDIIRRITNKPLIALVFSSLYIFENALIVHSRGAMLESSLIFFILLALDYYVKLLTTKKIKPVDWIIWGCLIGLAVSVQWMGVVLLSLFPFLFFQYQKSVKLWKEKLIDGIFYGLLVIAGVAIVWLGVFYLHFVIGSQVVSKQYYQASEKYKVILEKKQTAKLSNFPIMLNDYLQYISTYNAGIPKSDICKYPDENGTSPWGWPFGNKSINYRWEKDGKGVRYLYLIGNPLIWLIGIVGVLIGLVYVISQCLYKVKSKDVLIDLLIKSLLTVYIIYMVMMIYLETKRAFYLYHYLPALVMSLLLSITVFWERLISTKKQNRNWFYAIMILGLILIIICYGLFSPFTYYQPLTTVQFQWRNWFSWWHLKPIL